MSQTPPSSVRPRPLSPHLQIYKPQMTSMLSILHRACGVALAAGLGFITWMLVAAASGPEQFALVVDLGSSPLGLLMLFGWSFALMYHMCNGIRHLIWDTGHVFEINQATRAGYAVLAAAVILTTLIWAFALTN